MFRILSTISIVSIAVVPFVAADQEINELKARYDFDGLLAVHSAVKDRQTKENLFTLCSINYALSVVADYKYGHGKAGEQYAQQALRFGKTYLNENNIPSKNRIECLYILSAMSARLINDASSWMKYNGDKKKYLTLLFNLAPTHLGANLIKARDYIHMPENVGGNPQKGLKMLLDLERRHPQADNIPIELGHYYRDHKDTPNAEKYFKKALEINPLNLLAKKNLNEIRLEKKGVIIRKIDVDPQTKISKERILKKLAPFVGKPYTTEVKEKMEQAVSAISVVKGCTFKTILLNPDELEIVVKPNEDNLIIKGFGINVMVYEDYQRDLQVGGYPAYMYINHNIWGTGHDLQLIFAGLYINTQYSIFGLIDDSYPDIVFKWESLFLKVPSTFYNNGQEISELEVESYRHNFAIMLGKKFDFGLSAFIEAKADVHHFEKSYKNNNALVAPETDRTYTMSLPVKLSTLDNNPSKLLLRDGFSVAATPEYIFKTHYETWGLLDNSEMTFNHDSRPCRRVSFSAKYYRKIFDTQNIGAELSYFTGSNYYQLEKWQMGNAGLIQNQSDLSGYFPNEFDFRNGALLNFYYGINIIPEKFAIYSKWDSFYHNDLEDWFNGVALGTAIKLPYNMELIIEGSLGLDAERKDDRYGYGIEFLIYRFNLS